MHVSVNSNKEFTVAISNFKTNAKHLTFNIYMYVTLSFIRKLLKILYSFIYTHCTYIYKKSI